MKTYVHGYSGKESCRLADQAGTLTELLHGDIAYPAGSRVLEAGCGVGAQTLTLSRSSPDARFECMDISEVSLNQGEPSLSSRETTAPTTATPKAGRRIWRSSALWRSRPRPAAMP